MAENYLITGYWGEPHVTAENDRGINAAIFGTGRFVLPVGEMFRAEFIGGNTIRMYSGKLLDNGAAAGIPAGEYIDFTIPEAGQGISRNDLIVFQYSKDLSTNIESGSFVVVAGAETIETAADPTLTQNDLLAGEAVLDQMALWRIKVSGTTIGAPEQVFNTKFAGERIVTAHSTDGINYTASFPGICHLYNGLEITVIPDKNNANTTINLDLNGLGDKVVKRPLSSSTFVANALEVDFLRAGVPCRLMYHASYASGGIWLMAEKQKTSAQDLYGDVPVQSGGIAINTNTTDEEIAIAKDRIENILGDGIKGVLCVDYSNKYVNADHAEILEAYNSKKLVFLRDLNPYAPRIAYLRSVNSSYATFAVTSDDGTSEYTILSNGNGSASLVRKDRITFVATLTEDGGVYSCDETPSSIHAEFVACRHCVLVRGSDIYNLVSSNGQTCMFERTRYAPGNHGETVAAVIEQVLIFSSGNVQIREHAMQSTLRVYDYE